MIRELDWTKECEIPSGKEMEKRMRKHLLDNRHKLTGPGIRDEIIRRCTDQEVLDIGAIEHGYTNMHKYGINKDKSMFFRIKEVAMHVTGTDIIEKDVKRMQDYGYDFRYSDATSNDNLGEKYKVINIGDVIEHVDNPIKLLKYAKRHLTENGEILVTTPNPYYFMTIINLWKEKEMIANFQHISGIIPCHALEIGRRAGLTLTEYYIAEPVTPWKRWLTKWIPDVYKSGVFLYVYKRDKNDRQ